MSHRVKPAKNEAIADLVPKLTLIENEKSVKTLYWLWNRFCKSVYSELILTNVEAGNTTFLKIYNTSSGSQTCFVILLHF